PNEHSTLYRRQSGSLPDRLHFAAPVVQQRRAPVSSFFLIDRSACNSSINDERLPSNKSRPLGSKKQHTICNVIRVRKPSARSSSLDARLLCFRKFGHHVAFEITRCDRIHTYVRWP